MTAFDSTINVVATQISAPDEEQIKNGVPPVIELRLDVGLDLPFSQGPGTPQLVVPAGSIRFTLPSDAAVEFFKKGLEAAENLPKPSDLVTASDLSSVEAAAERLAKITKGK